MSIRPTLFSGPFLDRRAELRDDPAWIAAARADPATRYVLAAGATQLVDGQHPVEIALPATAITRWSRPRATTTSPC